MIANVLAMPIVSVLVMPAGLLAIVAIPFGLDGPLWRLMGLGIDWMIWVAQFVAGLPGAVGRIVAQPAASDTMISVAISRPPQSAIRAPRGVSAPACIQGMPRS